MNIKTLTHARVVRIAFALSYTLATLSLLLLALSFADPNADHTLTRWVIVGAASSFVFLGMALIIAAWLRGSPDPTLTALSDGQLASALIAQRVELQHIIRSGADRSTYETSLLILDILEQEEARRLRARPRSSL